MTGIQYNTGTTATSNNSASVNFTIPNTGGLNSTGVQVGDVMLLDVDCLTEDATPPTISFSGGGGTWQLVPMTDGSANPQVVSQAGFYQYSYAYQRVATAADIGATVTISETGSVAATTWWAVAMAAYTGANQFNPIDRAGGSSTFLSSAGSLTLASETARIAGDWAVYLCAADGSGTISVTGPSGSTQRQTAQSSGDLVAIYDSNGTTGLTSVGGTFATTNSNSFMTGFTICLAPAGTYVVQQVSTNTATTVFGSNITAGGTVVFVPVMYGSANPTSSNPTLGGSAVPGAFLAQHVGDTSNCSHDIWVLPNCPGGQTTTTVTYSNFMDSTFAYEILGLGPNPVLDQSASVFANASAGNPGSQTVGPTGATAYGNEIAIAASAAYQGNITAISGGWTDMINGGNHGIAAYQVLSSSGATPSVTVTEIVTDSTLGIITLAPTVIFMIQSATNTGLGSTITVTLPYPTAPGNCLVVEAMGAGSGTNPHVTGVTLGASADNFEQLIQVGDPLTSAAIVDTWADPSCAGGQTSVVVTFSIVADHGGFVSVYEVKGVAASSILDQSSGAFSTATQATFDSGTTATTAQAAEIWFGVAGGYQTTITGPAAPWINIAQLNASTRNFISGYQIVPTTGTADYAGSFSPNSYEMGTVVALKSAPAGGGANVAGSVAAVSVAAPSGTESVSTPGSVAAVTIAAPDGARSVSTPGAAAAVTVVAPSGSQSVVVAGSTSVVVVSAPAGTAFSYVGTLISAAVQSEFQGFKSVTATAASEFAAGQPGQAGLVTLAAAPWFQMYPSRGH